MCNRFIHPVAHLASEQFVGFLGLLALGDIKEDAEHDSIGDVRIVALTASGNPPDIVLRIKFENQSRKRLPLRAWPRMLT